MQNHKLKFHSCCFFKFSNFCKISRAPAISLHSDNKFPSCFAQAKISFCRQISLQVEALILILIITFVIPCCNYLVVIYFCVGISVKYIAGKASALALCISYIIMLHSCCFHPEINTTVMVFYFGEKKTSTILYDFAYTIN